MDEMPIILPPALEQEIAALVKLTTADYDPASLVIPLVNPTGPTTIRFTVHYDVDTPTLLALIRPYTG
jgi:hypothetical protein